MDEKVIAMIGDMSRAQLGAVILGCGYALPTDKSLESLAGFVRSKYEAGNIEASDIVMEWEPSPSGLAD